MIVRVRITKKKGVVMRNWALHRCSESVTLRDLATSLIDGSSGNEFFPTIEPFHLHCRPVLGRCGMSMGDLVGTPINFTVADVILCVL